MILIMRISYGERQVIATTGSYGDTKRLLDSPGIHQDCRHVVTTVRRRLSQAGDIFQGMQMSFHLLLENTHCTEQRLSPTSLRGQLTLIRKVIKIGTYTFRGWFLVPLFCTEHAGLRLARKGLQLCPSLQVGSCQCSHRKKQTQCNCILLLVSEKYSQLAQRIVHMSFDLFSSLGGDIFSFKPKKYPTILRSEDRLFSFNNSSSMFTSQDPTIAESTASDEIVTPISRSFDHTINFPHSLTDNLT